MAESLKVHSCWKISLYLMHTPSYSSFFSLIQFICIIRFNPTHTLYKNVTKKDFRSLNHGSKLKLSKVFTSSVYRQFILYILVFWHFFNKWPAIETVCGQSKRCLVDLFFAEFILPSSCSQSASKLTYCRYSKSFRPQMFPDVLLVQVTEIICPFIAPKCVSVCVDTCNV